MYWYWGEKRKREKRKRNILHLIRFISACISNISVVHTSLWYYVLVGSDLKREQRYCILCRSCVMAAPLQENLTVSKHLGTNCGRSWYAAAGRANGPIEGRTSRLGSLLKVSPSLSIFPQNRMAASIVTPPLPIAGPGGVHEVSGTGLTLHVTKPPHVLQIVRCA
jgi:hypothetical protein